MHAPERNGVRGELPLYAVYTSKLLFPKWTLPYREIFLKLRSELRSDTFLPRHATIIDFSGIRIHDSLQSNHVFLPLTPTAPTKLTCNLYYNLPLQTLQCNNDTSIKFKSTAVSFVVGALIQNSFRTATVLSRTITELLVIDAQDFKSIFICGGTTRITNPDCGGTTSITDPDCVTFINDLRFLQGFPFYRLDSEPEGMIYLYFP